MKKYTKICRIIALSLLLLIPTVTIPSFTIHAEENNRSVLEEFLDALYGEEKVNIYSSSGEEVTDYYTKQWITAYKNKELDAIRESIIANNLEVVKTTLISEKNEPKAIDSVKTVQKDFYECKPNTLGNPSGNKEWKTRIVASILYSNSTNEVKRVWGSISAINVNFGSGFSVHMSNVSTSTSINGPKTAGTFSGSYKLTGTFADIGFTVNVSYGPVSRSVTIRP